MPWSIAYMPYRPAPDERHWQRTNQHCLFLRDRSIFASPFVTTETRREVRVLLALGNDVSIRSPCRREYLPSLDALAHAARLEGLGKLKVALDLRDLPAEQVGTRTYAVNLARALCQAARDRADASGSKPGAGQGNDGARGHFRQRGPTTSRSSTSPRR